MLPARSTALTRKVWRPAPSLITRRGLQKRNSPLFVRQAKSASSSLERNAKTTLARRYRPLVARNPRHRAALRAWLFLYVFVAIQLAWVLRPFIGSPRVPTQFLREDAWSNSYVVVWQLAVRFAGAE